MIQFDLDCVPSYIDFLTHNQIKLAKRQIYLFNGLVTDAADENFVNAHVGARMTGILPRDSSLGLHLTPIDGVRPEKQVRKRIRNGLD